MTMDRCCFHKLCKSLKSSLATRRTIKDLHAQYQLVPSYEVSDLRAYPGYRTTMTIAVAFSMQQVLC